LRKPSIKKIMELVKEIEEQRDINEQLTNTINILRTREKEETTSFPKTLYPEVKENNDSEDKRTTSFPPPPPPNGSFEDTSTINPPPLPPRKTTDNITPPSKQDDYPPKFLESIKSGSFSLKQTKLNPKQVVGNDSILDILAKALIDRRESIDDEQEYESDEELWVDDDQ